MLQLSCINDTATSSRRTVVVCYDLLRAALNRIFCRSLIYMVEYLPYRVTLSQCTYSVDCRDLIVGRCKLLYITPNATEWEPFAPSSGVCE